MAPQSTIVFDAVCVLCSANAQFVLRYDHGRYFQLAAMQGKVGRELYSRFGINPDCPESLVVVTGETVLRDSDAVIEIWSKLGWPWRALVTARMIPRSLRDPIYRWMARHRYRLFGKRQTCWLPRPEDADRVL